VQGAAGGRRRAALGGFQLKLETTVPPLAVPGDWQGPQTADHWWCVGCGMWERCDDLDVCERCVRRTQQSDAGKLRPPSARR
jgi:hypothetical protein